MLRYDPKLSRVFWQRARFAGTVPHRFRLLYLNFITFLCVPLGTTVHYLYFLRQRHLVSSVSAIYCAGQRSAVNYSLFSGALTRIRCGVRTTVLMPRPSPNSSLLTEDSDSDCKSKALKQAASQQKQQGLFREADIVLYLCSQDAACHLKTCVTYTYM